MPWARSLKQAMHLLMCALSRSHPVNYAHRVHIQLIRYFTCGPDEVRAWTIRRGTKAPQAAGVIQYVFYTRITFHYRSTVCPARILRTNLFVVKLCPMMTSKNMAAKLLLKPQGNCDNKANLMRVSQFSQTLRPAYPTSIFSG